MSTGTSKINKLLKMPSDSISEGVVFQISWGHAPDPLVLACFGCPCASHTMSVNMPASPTSTMMTGLAVPPFRKSRSTSEWLLTKLRYPHSYGITGSTYNWIQTWLTCHSQCIVLHSRSSSFIPVLSGVSQGTVLGPLMFLLYIKPAIISK